MTFEEAKDKVKSFAEENKKKIVGLALTGIVAISGTAFANEQNQNVIPCNLSQEDAIVLTHSSGAQIHGLQLNKDGSMNPTVGMAAQASFEQAQEAVNQFEKSVDLLHQFTNEWAKPMNRITEGRGMGQSFNVCEALFVTYKLEDNGKAKELAKDSVGTAAGYWSAYANGAIANLSALSRMDLTDVLAQHPELGKRIENKVKDLNEISAAPLLGEEFNKRLYNKTQQNPEISRVFSGLNTLRPEALELIKGNLAADKEMYSLHEGKSLPPIFYVNAEKQRFGGDPCTKILQEVLETTNEAVKNLKTKDELDWNVRAAQIKKQFTYLSNVLNPQGVVKNQEHVNLLAKVTENMNKISNDPVRGAKFAKGLTGSKVNVPNAEKVFSGLTALKGNAMAVPGMKLGQDQSTDLKLDNFQKQINLIQYNVEKAGKGLDFEVTRQGNSDKFDVTISNRGSNQNLAVIQGVSSGKDVLKTLLNSENTELKVAVKQAVSQNPSFAVNVADMANREVRAQRETHNPVKAHANLGVQRESKTQARELGNEM